MKLSFVGNGLEEELLIAVKLIVVGKKNDSQDANTPDVVFEIDKSVAGLRGSVENRPTSIFFIFLQFLQCSWQAQVYYFYFQSGYILLEVSYINIFRPNVSVDYF